MLLKPGAKSLRQKLEQRARLDDAVRRFFKQRQVLEVVTPLVTDTTVSDPHIHSLAVHSGASYESAPTGFLQTSPEFAMKRLLAAGSGAIFQLCKAFRAGESGRQHNPEFTLLEWYQPGYQLEDLMGELSELITVLAVAFDHPVEAPHVLSYKSLFSQRYDLDPHLATGQDLLNLAKAEFPDSIQHLEFRDEGFADDVRDLLFSQGIQPGLLGPTLVTGFPASQAALAKLKTEDNTEVAARFELYWQGIELANGYDELLDGNELIRRIERDNRIRKSRGHPEVAVDNSLLAAMQAMPACCGIALGIDRLLMLLSGQTDIRNLVNPTD